MSDAPQTTPQPNEPEARAPDGTLNPAGTNPTTEATSTTPPAPSAPAGAPDTYADFTAPDGVTLDKDALAKAAPIFKELNLTQEQAQKLVTLTAQREADLGKASKAAQENTWKDTQAQWQRDAKAEWGNRLDSEVLPVIGRAIDAMPEADRNAFREAMNLTGAGNHPAFIKAFYTLAKQVGEGSPVAGAPPSAPRNGNPGWAGSMYPNNPSGAPQ